MTFFYPRQTFLEAMRKIVGKRMLFDCGCGQEALFLQEMMKRKVKAIGFDPHFDMLADGVPLSLAGKIVPVAAETFSMIHNLPAVITTCRPCHNGFPGLINRARHPKSEQYYIGFAKNVEHDLLDAPVKLVLSNVGSEGENLYLVKKEAPQN